jgi:hypothetical protein
MTLVTLQRQAPVAQDALRCGLCDAPISGKLQDHLLVGQPGTAQVQAVACERCGATLTRLVELCGSKLDILIRDEARVPRPRSRRAK